jgi:hypothetical protein
MTAKLRARQNSEWEARQARRRQMIIAIWVGVGLLFISMLGYLVWQELNPAPLPGVAVPIQGQEHIPAGSPRVAYNSDPPTSGPHYDTAIQAGFYTEAPPDENLVHNLEHGHVIIWYNCTGLSDADCDTLKSQVQQVMGRAGVSGVTGTLKLVGVPRPTMETRLALTSWGRIDRLDEFDRERILAFIRAFRDRAPENNAP